MVSAPVRVEQARFAQGRGVGLRRACAITGVSRSSVYYCHRMLPRDEAVIKVMKELSGKHPRYGSRRIRVFLGRQGILIGKTRCRRLWSKAGLQVPRKKRRKIAVSGLRIPSLTVINTVWSYDFVHDMCANGQNIKCLTVVDEYTRECLAIEVSGRIRSLDVLEVLSSKPRQNGD